MSEWRDISTAPKDGTVVLLWGCSEDDWEDAHDEGEEPRYSAYPASTSIQPGIWWLEGHLRQVEGATHWMPLPSPPKVEE